MTVWIYVLLGLVAAVGLLLISAALKSKDLRVSRSRKMNAPAEKVYEQVNELRNMNSWNPFLRVDPNAKVTYEGPSAGIGAICTWDGDRNVGAGKQTIVETRPPELVRMKLEFYRPFPGFNDVEFTFVPQGTGTEVTWTMTCQLAFVPRLVGTFMSMEKMIGSQFDKGLSDMQAIVEAGR